MKYIPAEKLIAEIERLHKAHSGKYGCDEVGLNLEYLEDFITSLQQEQPAVALKQAYPYVPGWRLNEDNNKPAINHSILMLTKHGVAEGEWNGNEWTQYRWSCKVKDTEVLYWIHLEDLTQLEKEGDSLQQEQPEVDLEKELDRIWFDNKLGNYFDNDALDFAHIRTLCKHFYELGLNTRK